MRTVLLNDEEIEVLDRQDPATERDGGWQSLMVDLQGRVNRATGEITLQDVHEERIPRYAFDYKNGGWENRLKSIFQRTLGPNLGR